MNKRILYLSFIRSISSNRELIARLTEREIYGRYRGSILGVGWSLLQPLALLGVYTLVFSQIFRSRWGSLEGTGPLGFAINLFAGLIVFNLFSESISKAPYLVTKNPNYVKKVVFPLEALGVVTVGNSIFHSASRLIILMIFELIAFHKIPLSILWLPIVWIPLILGTLACTWLLSAAGVFLRDIGQLIGVAISMMMFLSPIFYPVSALPEKFQPLLLLNPIAAVIQQTRKVIVLGQAPSLHYVLIGTLATIITCEASYRIFNKSKHAFADVI